MREVCRKITIPEDDSPFQVCDKQLGHEGPCDETRLETNSGVEYLLRSRNVRQYLG